MKKNIIKDTFIYAVILAIVNFSINILFAYYSVDKGIVKVGSAIEMKKGEYQIDIDIINFSDSSFDNIRINIPENIELDKIKTNKPLNIRKVVNNVSSESGSIFDISRIAEKEKVHMVFLLDKIIESSSITVEKNNNRLKIEYLNDIKSPLKTDLNRIAVNTIIYSVMIGIFYYLVRNRNDEKITEAENRNNEKITEYNEKITEYKESINKEQTKVEENKNELNKIEDSIKEIKVENKKRELLLMARVKDYKKELNFWKDTIRKIIYESKNKKINKDILFDTVTDTLKTYQTKRKDEKDFETIEILASIINKTDKGKKIIKNE